jgi:Tfp pilus assembly protein PilF
LIAKEKVLGAEHSNPLPRINNLGLVLSRPAKYEAAEVMHQQALIAKEKVLGAECPSTLTSVNNLGYVLNRQGKYEQANETH